MIGWKNACAWIGKKALQFFPSRNSAHAVKNNFCLRTVIVLTLIYSIFGIHYILEICGRVHINYLGYGVDSVCNYSLIIN